MIKVDNGTADTGQKMYKFNNDDIDLIVMLLEQELEMHVYGPNNPEFNRFYKRSNHLQSLIKEFKK
tara:strand:- start:389 stop:586 length:198 start_codon:yes stop_codon:yes gene_type:complete